MLAKRIRFTDLDVDSFVPSPTSLARISLAWWEQGDPEPVFVRGLHGGPSTVVIVWPTDHRGLLISSELERHNYSILPWHLDEVAMTRLHDIHTVWNLAKHDVHVGGQISPCTESIRKPFLKEINRRIPPITQNLMKGQLCPLYQRCTNGVPTPHWYRLFLTLNLYFVCCLWIPNPQVPGSSPGAPATFFLGFRRYAP